MSRRSAREKEELARRIEELERRVEQIQETAERNNSEITRLMAVTTDAQPELDEVGG